MRWATDLGVVDCHAPEGEAVLLAGRVGGTGIAVLSYSLFYSPRRTRKRERDMPTMPATARVGEKMSIPVGTK